MADGTIDSKKYIFIADLFSSRVFMYRDDGSKKPKAIIATQAESAGGVAFKPAGVP